MKAMGLSGRVEFYRPDVTYPGLIVQDLIKGASLRVVESDDGPLLKEWRPFEMLSTGPSGLTDEAASFS